MAEQKILISIQINDSQAAKTNKALKVTKDNFNSLTDAEMKSIVADKQKALSAKAVDKALTGQAAAANAAAKSTDNMRATSGLNNAIIMETSRLASDASFGFTAIANNLSQLVNLVQANVSATGSFKEAIKGLFTAQAAFLIGIQLLITYGSDLFKIFKDLAGGADLLKETFKNAGNEVSSTAGKFETYIRTLQDSNKSQDEQKKAIQALNKEFPEYIKQLDEAKVSLADVANNTSEAVEQNDIYRESLVALAMARASQNKIDELVSEQLQNEIDAKNQLKEVSDLSIEQAEELSKSLDETISKREDEVISIRKKTNVRNEEVRGDDIAVKRIIENRDKENEKLDEQIDALIEYTQVQLNSAEKGSKGRNRIFKAADLDFEKETQKSRERLLKGFIKDEKRQIKIKFDGIRERARLKQKEFEDDQQRRLDEYLSVEKDEAKRLDAQNRFNNEIAKSKESLNNYIKQLNAEQLVSTNNLTIEQAQKTIDADRELQYKLDENRQRAADQEILNEGIKAGNLFELKNQQLSAEQERIQLALDNENLTFQERMNLQKQLTDVEQQQTDARIQIAELEAKSKMQLLDVTADALGAFSKLAGKETAAGKALAVASTLISTYTAGQKAYESQFLPIPTTSSPLRGTIAKIAAYASGFASVKEILKVKTPAGAGTSGSGVGGNAIQAPAFNVVGASQTSQLAETVAGQQAKPVKAFVVGKDISTQQELDRNITNTASFG